MGAGSILAADQDDCNFECRGNASEFCGAGDRLELYTYILSSSPATSSILSTSLTTISTSSTTHFLVTSFPTLSPSSTTSASFLTFTPTISSTRMVTSSATMSSPEPSSQPASTSSLTQPMEIPTSASGVPSHTLTASKTLTETSAVSQPTNRPPVTSYGNANFTFYACVSEPSAGRLLSNLVVEDDKAMSITKCLSECYMYQYAGVEYGSECW